MNNVNMITLNNGVQMPQEEFGVYQINGYDNCKQAVKDAISVGYRAFDTAQAYQNEDAVGAAIKESDVDRNNIFITTKVWSDNYGYDKTIDSVKKSMAKLQTDYLDLVILHQAANDYYSAYRALEKMQKDGQIRAIGVSNFTPERFVDLALNADVIPAINQVETHVFNQQKEAIKYAKEYGTKIESWGPLAEGKNNFFHNEVLSRIGKKHDKSVAQVALKFLIQNGIIIIPKSTNIDRMKQNLDIWDFELNDDEFKQIQSLDLNKGLLIDLYDPETIKQSHEMHID